MNRMCLKALAVLVLCAGVESMPPGFKNVEIFDNRLNGVKYADCHDLHQAGYNESGTYEIWVNDRPLKVFCQNKGATSAIVIQRREHGDFNFNQQWASYVSGFGHQPPARGDFWIGLQTIHHLTAIAGNTILTFVLQDWNGNVQQLSYRDFRVMDASQKYRMFVGPKISGVLADDFSFNNAMPFATYDNPDHSSCAVNQQAGWWYNYCTYTLPNGYYYQTPHYTPPLGYYNGIYWKDWYGYDYSLKFISMSVAHP